MMKKQKKKLENIRNKVSSYSKIYDNISTKINVPIDEKLKIQNNKIPQ